MVDARAYNETIRELKKFQLSTSLRDMLSVSEKAWKAQRSAIRQIDIKNDEIKGHEDLIELLFALDDWVEEMEVIANGSKKIAERANKAVHKGGRNLRIEEDGKGDSYLAKTGARARRNFKIADRKGDL